MEIQNKVAFITGAATRVGKQVALEFAKKGANIAITYLNSTEPWQETLEEIQDLGVKAITLEMDVRYPENIIDCVDKTYNYFGRFDILVNNASIWLMDSFINISLDDWNSSINVNLTGPFLCSQAVAPIMLQQKSGVIINIVDLSAFQTWPKYAHHSASKAGLVALTRVMAVELSPYIRVNAIAPGTVLLPEKTDDLKRQWAIDNSLLKRIGEPKDVARTAIYLTEMDFITGATFFVDGGRMLV